MPSRGISAILLLAWPSVRSVRHDRAPTAPWVEHDSNLDVLSSSQKVKLQTHPGTLVTMAFRRPAGLDAITCLFGLGNCQHDTLGWSFLGCWASEHHI